MGGGHLGKHSINHALWGGRLTGQHVVDAGEDTGSQHTSPKDNSVKQGLVNQRRSVRNP